MKPEKPGNHAGLFVGMNDNSFLETLFTPGESPLTVAYGMGVDSTAILVGLHQAGERPDLITFADTGSEKQATYDYLPVISAWLQSVGFPPITIVRYQAKNFKNYPPYKSLFENCLTNWTLPSISFGFQRHSCSVKWKLQPQLDYIRQWQPAREAWNTGAKVVRCVGYDCSETKRMEKARNKIPEGQDHLFENRYPLLEWGWDREACIAAIQNAGLQVPVKSACYFCAASRPHELHDLTTDELRKIVIMERRAEEKCDKVEGLWFKEVKGTRGAEKRPGSMTEYIRQQSLLPHSEIDTLRERTPTGVITVDDTPDWDHFIEHLTSDLD